MESSEAFGLNAKPTLFAVAWPAAPGRPRLAGRAWPAAPRNKFRGGISTDDVGAGSGGEQLVLLVVQLHARDRNAAAGAQDVTGGMEALAHAAT